MGFWQTATWLKNPKSCSVLLPPKRAGTSEDGWVQSQGAGSAGVFSSRDGRSMCDTTYLYNPLYNYVCDLCQGSYIFQAWIIWDIVGRIILQLHQQSIHHSKGVAARNGGGGQGLITAKNSGGDQEEGGGCGQGLWKAPWIRRVFCFFFGWVFVDKTAGKSAKDAEVGVVSLDP